MYRPLFSPSKLITLRGSLRNKLRATKNTALRDIYANAIGRVSFYLDAINYGFVDDHALNDAISRNVYHWQDYPPVNWRNWK